MHQSFWQKHQSKLELIAVLLLAASVRLTSLSVFRAVDEEDRWAWAVDFYRALLAGDLPATLVGDGYPGIFPVWLETIWLLLGSIYRSALQGGWFGEDGLYLLIHEWSRTEYLGVQRFPVALANTVLVVIIFLYLRRLFSRPVALLAIVLISLDPFYLSDSRVNRAEGLLTGLMMISLLALIAHLRRSERRHLLVSALFGGLAWLTKSQALVLLPMFGAISLVWCWRQTPRLAAAIGRAVGLMAGWTLGAALTFVLLWPAAWSAPGPTFSLMFNYAAGKVGAQNVKLFFLGQTFLDEDPGLIFYPVIFLLRSTPLMLIGLLLGLWVLARYLRQRSLSPTDWRTWLDDAGTWALLAYALLYAGGMSLGGHKQDRFLMTAFPALNVLAAMGFVALARRRNWTSQQVWLGGAALLAIQLATALPYHPYYFSYFNPLVGGGPAAERLTRIGWGEGMDQVADYLQSQPEPEKMVVATRFWRYLLNFKGHKLNLDNDGEWARADKIIFYIQQSQRMLDPSPGVIRYFQTHVPPEKIITINGINYAHIYPNPIQYPADPQVDQIEQEMRLYGYRWLASDGGPTTVRLFWQNWSDRHNPVGLRLWANQTNHTGWLPCVTRPGFDHAAQTAGEVVESDCPLPAAELPPGLYDLQVGVQQPDGIWQPLDFAAGWAAVEKTAAGALQRVAPAEAFAKLAAEAVPESAARLPHLFAGRVRLLATEVAPAQPMPGQPLTVTLYWQAQRVLDRNADISLQAFVGQEQRVALKNGPPGKPTRSWQPGEVIREEWELALPADLPTPALLRLDVNLYLPETVSPLPVTNLTGEDIPGAIAYLRLEPPDGWPNYQGSRPLAFTFGDSVALIGYDTAQTTDRALDVTLYWESQAALPPDEQHTAFVHLLNPEGELIAQSDVPPANGLFPTPAWQPGDVVLSRHKLSLPATLPPGDYRLLAGLYRTNDGSRLPATGPAAQPLPNNAAPLDPTITLP